MTGWVIAFVLTLVLPDGRTAELEGRSNRVMALDACLGELQRFHAGDVSIASTAPGALVVGVQAVCTPSETAEQDTPSPRPRLRAPAA